VAPLILRFHFCRCYLQDAARWLGCQVPPPDGVAPRFTSFYGPGVYGGNTNAECAGTCGSLFSLSVGLGPIVALVQQSGKAGQTVEILGTQLNGTTAVYFNGTSADFTFIISDTEISATVPTGATAGFVTVATPTATLKSNTRFQVRP